MKPREIGHDVQLYRLYQMEAARLEHDGARIARVVLDYELKRDYQTFLHRRDRPEGTSHETDRQAFGAARQLPIIEGHLELPDLRIEYETEDGRIAHRDVELVTSITPPDGASGVALASSVWITFSRPAPDDRAAVRLAQAERPPVSGRSLPQCLSALRRTLGIAPPLLGRRRRRM